VRFDLLLHLDLLGVAFLLEELCAEAVQFLGILGLFVRGAGDAFAGSLFVVEPERSLVYGVGGSS